MIAYLTPIIVGLAVLGVVTGIRALAIGAVELAYGLARLASTSSGKRATAGGTLARVTSKPQRWQTDSRLGVLLRQGSEGDAKKVWSTGHLWADEWS